MCWRRLGKKKEERAGREAEWMRWEMRGCVERRGVEWRQMEKDYNVLLSLIDGAQRILRCRGEKMETRHKNRA